MVLFTDLFYSLDFNGLAFLFALYQKKKITLFLISAPQILRYLDFLAVLLHAGWVIFFVGCRLINVLVSDDVQSNC